MLNRLKLLWLGLFACVLLALLLWLMMAQKQPAKIKPINQVSLKTSETEQTQKRQSIKQKLEARTAQIQKLHQDNAPNESKVDDDWSYLAIYRRLEWAVVCERYYNFLSRSKINVSADFVTEFTKSYHNQEEIINENDPRVVEGLNRYKTQCESLKTKVFAYAQVDGADAKNTHTVKLELQTLLDTTSAKTEKEKRIKSHVVMVQSFNRAQNELQKSYQESVQSEAENVKVLQRQMISLSEEMLALEERFDSEEALAEYQALISEINHIDDQWVESYKGKGEAYQIALSNVLHQWVEIQAHLVGSDPDVFKLTKMASEWAHDPTSLGISVSAYRSEMIPNLNTPGEQMMEAFGISSFALFSEAANPAAILYLCGLGYDCGSESALAAQLCLVHFKEVPAACEVSVQDFYLKHALSPNLLDDVLTLYQWMEDNYDA